MAKVLRSHYEGVLQHLVHGTDIQFVLKSTVMITNVYHDQSFYLTSDQLVNNTQN